MEKGEKLIGIVMDTNVLISASLSRDGKCAKKFRVQRKKT